MCGEAVNSHRKEADEDMLPCFPRGGCWHPHTNEAGREIVDFRSTDSMEEVGADLSEQETG